MLDIVPSSIITESSSELFIFLIILHISNCRGDSLWSPVSILFLFSCPSHPPINSIAIALIRLPFSLFLSPLLSLSLAFCIPSSPCSPFLFDFPYLPPPPLLIFPSSTLHPLPSLRLSLPSSLSPLSVSPSCFFLVFAFFPQRVSIFYSLAINLFPLPPSFSLPKFFFYSIIYFSITRVLFSSQLLFFLIP